MIHAYHLCAVGPVRQPYSAPLLSPSSTGRWDLTHSATRGNAARALPWGLGACLTGGSRHPLLPRARSLTSGSTSSELPSTSGHHTCRANPAGCARLAPTWTLLCPIKCVVIPLSPCHLPIKTADNPVIIARAVARGDVVAAMNPCHGHRLSLVVCSERFSVMVLWHAKH